MAKRAGNLNTEQKTILIEFVKKNPKIVEGKFTKDFTFKDSQKKWTEISEILNTVPNGGAKTWKQWRKVWQDMKTKAKSKKSLCNKSRLQTGGGPPIEEYFDDTENEILSVVSKTAIEGVENIKETYVPLCIISVDQNDTEFNSVINIAEPVNQAPVEKVEVVSVVEQNEIREETKTSTSTHKTPKQDRLQKSVNASETMADMCKRKLDLKEFYYKQKLLLMTEDIKIKKEISENIKTLTDLLSKKWT